MCVCGDFSPGLNPCVERLNWELPLLSESCEREPWRMASLLGSLLPSGPDLHRLLLPKSPFICPKDLRSSLFLPSPHACRQAETWAPCHHSLPIPLLFCVSSVHCTQPLPFVYPVHKRPTQKLADLRQCMILSKSSKNQTLRSTWQPCRCPHSWSFPVYLEKSLCEAALPLGISPGRYRL